MYIYSKQTLAGKGQENHLCTIFTSTSESGRTPEGFLLQSGQLGISKKPVMYTVWVRLVFAVLWDYEECTKI